MNDKIATSSKPLEVKKNNESKIEVSVAPAAGTPPPVLPAPVIEVKTVKTKEQTILYLTPISHYGKSTLLNQSRRTGLSQKELIDRAFKAFNFDSISAGTDKVLPATKTVVVK